MMVNIPYGREKDMTSHWPPSPDLTSNWHNDAALCDELGSQARAESDRIDKELAAEKARLSKPAVRILLLGQSESGKSTTLRNFQLSLAPKAFAADTEAWRTVIHLNLVISVNYLLDFLQNTFQAQRQQESVTHAFKSSSPPPTHSAERDLVEKGRFRLHVDTQSVSVGASFTSASSSPREANPSSAASEAVEPHSLPRCSTEVRRLMLTLKPLRSVETTLRRRLGAESPSDRPRLDQDAVHTRRELIRSSSNVPSGQQASSRASPTGSDPYSNSNSKGRRAFGFGRHRESSGAAANSTSSSSNHSLGEGSAHLQNHQDIFDTDTKEILTSQLTAPGSVGDLVDSFVVKVRGGTGWRGRARMPGSDSSSGAKDIDASAAIPPSIDEVTQQEEHELLSARHMIEVFGSDIDWLWRSEEVRAVLAGENIRLDKRPGFFLDEVLRVTAPDYIPSTTDIFRARLSTTGVEEHCLTIESGRDAGKEWIIYDVGGYRSQRTAWAPYFDSMNAIIFLAPISAFDECLAEDPSVNRLVRNLHASNPKGDVLTSVPEGGHVPTLDKHLWKQTATLRGGLRFSDFVTSYDDQGGTKNDPESISRYLLQTFHEVHKEVSPRRRKLRAYLTSVIDSRATAKVITHVREQLLVDNLTHAHII